jgi:plasmid replication initiation protein
MKLIDAKTSYKLLAVYKDKFLILLLNNISIKNQISISTFLYKSIRIFAE